MLILTSLTIWPRWDQADSNESGFVGRGETGFAVSGGSSFTGRVKLASLAAVDLVSQVWKNWALLETVGLHLLEQSW